MRRIIPGFLCVQLFCTSCLTTSYLKLELLKPAEVGVPENITSLAILNRSLYHLPDSLVNDTLGIIETFPGYMINVASTEAVFGISQILSENPGGLSISQDEILESIPAESAFPVPEFSQEELMELSRQIGAEGLISLDYILLDDILITETEFALSDGSYLPYYIGGIQRFIKVLWRFYDLSNTTLLDQALIKDTMLISYSKSAWDPLSAIDMIFVDRDFVMDSYMKTGFRIALFYSKRLAPFYQQEYRLFFTGRAPWLILAGRYMSRNSFSEARRILAEYTRHQNPRKAALAFFNLAVISEAEGDYDEAIRLLEKSTSLRDHKIHGDYRNILNNRILEIKTIDEQLTR